MLPAQRRNLIHESISKKGFVSVTDLSLILGVSETTIRRDLDEMENDGLLSRTHGGAQLPRDVVHTFDQSQRETRYNREKRLIGQKMAEILAGVETMIIDAGTTTREVARHLRPSRPTTIITDSVDIAYELKDAANISLIVTGGVVRRGAYNLFGPLAEHAFSDLHVQVCVMGASGISADRGISKLDIEANTVRRKMIDGSDELIVVADSSKFGAIGLVTVASVDEIDKLITDSGIPRQERRRFEDYGVEVIICDEQNVGQSA